jgi:hypothetical protein
MLQMWYAEYYLYFRNCLILLGVKKEVKHETWENKQHIIYNSGSYL